MANNRVIIRLIRDDNVEFKIDGGEWRIPSDGLDGFGSLDNDITMNSNAFGDGSAQAGERLGHRDRTVKAIVRDSNKNAVLRQQAINFFKFKHSFKLYITYMGVTRWCEGSLHKLQVSEGNIYKAVSLQFTILSAIPYFKSVDNFGKDIAEVIPMIGFPYINTSKGMPTGIYNFEKEVNIYNDGDVDTFCKAVFKANGDVVNPKLLVNGKFVRIITNMVKDDVVIMDFTTPRVNITKNGVNIIGATDRTSDLSEMNLNIGDNVIGYSADDGDSSMQVSIYYNKLYALL
jgi:hypothetical protein